MPGKPEVVDAPQEVSEANQELTTETSVPEDPNPQEVSEATQELTTETSVPEDPNANMDGKTASPKPKDVEPELTTVHHTDETCDLDKSLASYKGVNHGKPPSKRKTTQ